MCGGEPMAGRPGVIYGLAIYSDLLPVSTRVRNFPARIRDGSPPPTACGHTMVDLRLYKG